MNDRRLRCPFCKGPMEEELLDFVVQLEDGQEIMLEDVPTWVCESCDHTEVEESIIEAVEDMIAHLDTVAGGEIGD
ncbi:MAG: YgiT-type zinc finger protein [Candidatus Promineifilaceae bacterium]|nr:YgiT-type zinc finger protein [Candidatus Promineifilaceae bacterium]